MRSSQNWNWASFPTANSGVDRSALAQLLHDLRAAINTEAVAAAAVDNGATPLTLSVAVSAQPYVALAAYSTEALTE